MTEKESQGIIEHSFNKWLSLIITSFHYLKRHFIAFIFSFIHNVCLKLPEDNPIAKRAEGSKLND